MLLVTAGLRCLQDTSGLPQNLGVRVPVSLEVVASWNHVLAGVLWAQLCSAGALA